MGRLGYLLIIACFLSIIASGSGQVSSVLPDPEYSPWETPAPPAGLKWFETEQELIDWRNDHYFLLSGDCDDYAERLMQAAYEDGYWLPVVPVWKGKVFGETVAKTSKRHIGNWAWIENTFYYVEPQPIKNPIVKIEYTWRD